MLFHQSVLYITKAWTNKQSQSRFIFRTCKRKFKRKWSFKWLSHWFIKAVGIVFLSLLCCPFCWFHPKGGCTHTRRTAENRAMCFPQPCLATKRDWFSFTFYFLRLYWDITDIKHCVTFRCATWWSETHIMQNDYHNKVSLHIHHLNMVTIFCGGKNS